MREQKANRLRLAAAPRSRTTDASRKRIRPAEQQPKTPEAATDCYWYWNLDSNEIQFSDGILAPLGSSAARASKKGKFPKGIIHPAEEGAFGSHVQALLSGMTEELDFKCNLRARTGESKLCRIRGKVVQRDKHGLPLACAGAIFETHTHDIAQGELAKSHARLSAMFQVADDCIWVVDPETFQLVAFNKAYEDVVFRASGVRSRLGMHVEELVPETAEQWNQRYRDVLEHGRFDFDHQIISLGETFHVVLCRLVGDDQTVLGIVNVAHNVTHRRRMEESLGKSEEKFYKVFHDSPLAMTLTSLRDDRYLEVNKSFEDATGYKRDEVVGNRPGDFGFPLDPDIRIRGKEELKAKGTGRFEFAYRTKAGEIRFAIGTASLIDSHGERCILVMSTDITERKRTEDALRDSEERLQIAISSGRMYTSEWNPETGVVLRSVQSSEILGIDENEINATKDEFIGWIHPEDKETYQNALRSLKPESPSYRTHFRLIRRDQRTIWLEESGHAFFDLDGKMSRVVGMTSDVTEARESERMLRELSGRLITAQEEERSHIARELHDHIGQELALLCVQAQNFDSDDPDQKRTTHSDAHDLYRRIKEIAQDVSNLSHRLHSAELSFLGLQVAVERLCRDFAKLHNIDMDCQIKDVPKLDAAKSLCFYRILQESLQNVAKHSRATSVMVELRRKGNELILRIVDDGIGFDPEKVRFASGLGLVSIRERLNLIGGRLELTSGEGRGTCLVATVAIAN
jgi:PAS domain S-box-containing protein